MPGSIPCPHPSRLRRATYTLLCNCHWQLLDFDSLRGAPPRREGNDCATRTGTVPRSAGHFRNPPRLPSGAEGAPPADPQCQNPLEAAGAETLPVGGQLADDPGKAAWTGQPEVGAAVEAADSGREHSRDVVRDPASGFCGKYRPAGEYSDCTCSHLPPGLCPSPRRSTEASPAILDARIARSSFPTRQGLR